MLAARSSSLEDGGGVERGEGGRPEQGEVGVVGEAGDGEVK